MTGVTEIFATWQCQMCGSDYAMGVRGGQGAPWIGVIRGKFIHEFFIEVGPEMRLERHDYADKK